MSLDERINENNHSQYCVFFLNSKGWEVDEITEIFSAFGEVTSVRCAGDRTGYRFVEFSNLQDAKNAVEALEDHPDITLKKHHKKDRNNPRQAKKFDKPSYDSFGNDSGTNNRPPRRRNYDNGNNTDRNETENGFLQRRFEQRGVKFNRDRQEEQPDFAPNDDTSNVNGNSNDAEKDVSRSSAIPEEAKSQTAPSTSSIKKLSPFQKIAERLKKMNDINTTCNKNGDSLNATADVLKKDDMKPNENKEARPENEKREATNEDVVPQANEKKIVEVVNNGPAEIKGIIVEEKMEDLEAVVTKVDVINDHKDNASMNGNSISRKEFTASSPIDNRNSIVRNATTTTNDKVLQKVEPNVSNEKEFVDRKSTLSENNKKVPKIVEANSTITPNAPMTKNGLILEQEKESQESEVKILDAAEVIVGNIHEVCTEAYLLYLFEKFEPIAISKKWIVPKFDASYCHVYFKTPEDAAAVERYFDKHNVLGRNLIVLRSQNLLSVQ